MNLLNFSLDEKLENSNILEQKEGRESETSNARRVRSVLEVVSENEQN
jgi:hypothetical protein